MNPNAEPFAITFIAAFVVAAVAKGAELLGTLRLRRIVLISALLSLTTFFAFCVWGFWQHSWWRGAGLVAILIAGLAMNWKRNGFAEIRDEWAGRATRGGPH